MDMNFFNLTPEAQMELLNMMILIDDNNDLSEFPPQQSPPPPPPISYHLPPPPPLSNNIPTNEEVLPFVDPTRTAVAAMREVIFRMAAMQPVEIDPESVRPPKKRRNVRISKDPQSVAARQRRERISERIRILQQLVPRGSKMDTASMLDEAIHYVKFLKTQVQSLERAHMHAAANNINNINPIGNYYY